MRKILLLLAFVANFAIIFAQTQIQSVKSGDWNDPTTWDLGRVPQDGDAVIINYGHTITVSQSNIYNNLSVTINWGGNFVLNSGITLTVTSFTTNGGNTTPIQILGRLNVYGNLTISNGNFYIAEGGYVFVDGTVSASGGTSVNLDVYGTLETVNLDLSSITMTIGPNGKVIVHGNLTNSGNSSVTLNGGEFIVEGSYSNSGSADFTINNGGLFHIYGTVTNEGSANIIVNDGTVIIDGDFNNSGAAQLSIADGSYVEVYGNVSNTGGADIIIDGSMYVDGNLYNSGGATITGTGSLYINGTEYDYNNGVDDNLLLPKTYHTIASGDWLDPSIWSKTPDNAPANSTPPINSIVTISANTQVTINNIAKIKSLTIEDNAQFTLNPEANLTVFENLVINGTLIFNNNLTSSPNLIDQGPITYGVNAQIIQNLTVSAKQYHYLGTFIPNISSSIFRYVGTNYNPNLYQYDETQPDNWEDSDPTNDYLGWVQPSNTFNPGTGFIVYTDQQYTYTLSGTSITTGNVTVNVTLTPHPEFANSNLVDGWNLIANPYPSSIDATAFINDNSTVIDGNVYLWDDDNSNGADYAPNDYIQFNNTGVVNAANGGQFNGNIAPNQAFFVKAITNGQVIFTNTQRSNVRSVLLKAKKNTINMKKIKLALVKDSSLYNETLIGLSSITTDNFDYGYDGYKRKGNPDIAFYSIMNGYEMGIQALSDDFIIKQIPLGYQISTPGNYTIFLKYYNTPLNYRINLYDATTGQMHNLLLSPYNFYSDAGEFNDRFWLIIEKLSLATNLTSVYEYKINVYAFDNKLFIANNSDQNYNNLTIKVIDIQGKIILSKQVNLKAYTTEILNLNDLQTGIYIVNLKNNSLNISHKVAVIR